MAHTFRATTKVRGRQVQETFPIGTPDAVIAAWKARVRNQIDLGLPKARAGSLAADVPVYLATLIDRPALLKERERQLDWWTRRLGHLPRTSITAPMIARALAELRLSRAAGTCNHYRTALSHLWSTLDGKAAPSVLRDVKTHTEPDPEPRDLSPRTIALILEAWHNLGPPVKGQKRTTVNLAKVVATVMLHTGITPAEMRRLRPRDFHLEAASVYLQRRIKGKGIVGGEYPLSAAGVAALAAFRSAELVGRPFSSKSVRQGFVNVCRRLLLRGDLDEATRQELARARPYDLRHTFGTFVLERTMNLKVTQELMRHRSAKMTKRYVGGQVMPYLRAAVNLLEPADRLAETSGDDDK